MAISPIPKGTTRTISVTITQDGSNPDISADVVTLTFKVNKADADPGVLQENADVATDGANGVAVFLLTAALTEIEAAQYFYDVVWYVAGGGGEFVLDAGTVTIAERVSDV